MGLESDLSPLDVDLSSQRPRLLLYSIGASRAPQVGRGARWLVGYRSSERASVSVVISLVWQRWLSPERRVAGL